MIWHLVGASGRWKRSARKTVRRWFPAVFILFSHGVAKIYFWLLRPMVSFGKETWDSAEVVFLHIPKTGGSSVRNQLLKDYGETLLLLRGPRDIFRALVRKKHPGAIVIEHFNPNLLTRVGLITHDRLTEILLTVVRDPFARFESAFWHCSRRKILSPSFDRQKILSRVARIGVSGFIGREAESYLFFRPQTDYLEGTEILTEQVFRTEHLADIQNIYARQSSKIPITNVAPPYPAQTSDSSRMRLSLNRIYARDFELISRLCDRAPKV